MKLPKICAGLTGVVLAILSTSAYASEPYGIWLMSGGGMKIEITQCAQELCAVVAWLKKPKDKQGQEWRDSKNPDVALQKRPLLGTPVFSNMKQAQANVWNGDIYNPFDGSSYSNVSLTLVNDGQITIKGCRLLVLCGDMILMRSSLTETGKEVDDKHP